MFSGFWPPPGWSFSEFRFRFRPFPETTANLLILVCFLDYLFFLFCVPCFVVCAVVFLLAVSVCFCCAVVVCPVCAVLLFSRVFRSVSCDRCRLVFSCSVFLFLSVCAVRFSAGCFRLSSGCGWCLGSVLVFLWLPVVLFCSSFPFFPLSCLSCFLLHVFLFSFCSFLCVPRCPVCLSFLFVLSVFCGSAGVVSRCARGLSSAVACAWCCRHPVCCPVSVLMPVAGLSSVSVVPVFFLSVLCLSVRSGWLVPWFFFPSFLFFLLSLRCVSFPVLFFPFFSSFSGFVFSLSVFCGSAGVVSRRARGGRRSNGFVAADFCQWCFRG